MSGPDTVECENCGTEIRLTAQVCHNCGADNEYLPGRTISASHDPSNIESTVSEDWWWGVAGGTGLLVVGFLLSGVTEGAAGFFLLVGWIALPISGYFDMQHVRANSHWNPSTVFWVLGFVVPIVNAFFGGAYLYRRHETLDVP